MSSITGTRSQRASASSDGVDASYFELQRNIIPSIQYLGNKTRLIEKITTILKSDFPKAKSLIDLFAGTGSVAFAAQPHFQSIFANDIQKYSYVIVDALLNGATLPEEKVHQLMKVATTYRRQLSTTLMPALVEEERFGKAAVNRELYREYKRFCDETPHVYKPRTELKCFKSLAALAKEIQPGNQPVATIPPCLFITYYANTYFGIAQCLEIDSLRRAIEGVDDLSQKNILLAALMSAMSYSTSSTTHFAQFLKVNSPLTAKDLIERRSISVYDLFIKKLAEFRAADLLSRQVPLAQTGNLDYLDFLDKIHLDKRSVVYADPPYFKEHYSRYYHILDTVCLYDYPVLTRNPRLDDITVGRYREDRNISPFGKKSEALNAFRLLFEKCAKSGASLLLSYSDNSIVSLRDLIESASEFCTVKSYRFPLAHSKQGRSETTQVHELLLVAKPKKSKVENVLDGDKVAILLKELESMSPLYDNPVSLMHHYVARKPYNVVNRIVSSLNENASGIVCDPFAGSGTSLIEALKLGHSIIGADISKQSTLIMRTLFGGWNRESADLVLSDFYSRVHRKIEPIYLQDGERIIERVHFDLLNNKLKPVSYWYKKIYADGSLGVRKKASVDKKFLSAYRRYERISKNLFQHALIENKRIAVQPGSKVRDYLCARNRIALNILLKELNAIKNKRSRDLVELVLSSSLNLIKLSDKKASSQIPFWRPKKDITSRNALWILRDKIERCVNGLDYAASNFPAQLVSTGADFANLAIKCGTPAALVLHKPIQDIGKADILRNSVDLVLTDPPYTDQVPYLEYSQLSSLIFNWNNLDRESLRKEIVVSNAKKRKEKNLGNFNLEIGTALKQIGRILKPNAHCAIFFHDFSLMAWSNLLMTAQDASLAYRGEARIGRQRRSFKTVLTPNMTLDGNYLLVFKKRKIYPKIYSGNTETAIASVLQNAKDIILKNGGKASTQDLYDGGLLRTAIEDGYIHLLAQKYRTFGEVLKGRLIQTNGFWIVG